jgi:hypothetical protein
VRVGTFIATPVDPLGKIFKIPFTTLDEPVGTLQEMASKIYELTSFVSAKSYPGKEKKKSREVSIDLPKDYYGFAVTCSGPSEENFILIIAVKDVTMALFSFVVETCKSKISAVVDGLIESGRVRRESVQDLHLSLERELGSFKL